MPIRRILHLTAERLTVYRWQAGQPLIEAEFPADQEGVAAFGAWLVHHRHSLFHLLADLIDEGFHGEDIPRLYGRNRQALIRRKLSQHFHGTPLTVALPQGQSQNHRHGEHLLLCALTAPQLIEPWLTALRDNAMPLVGLWSVSTILPTLLRGVRQSCEYGLLITLGEAGLRQSFFRAGQLCFSRLTPLAHGVVQEAAQAAARESVKIHHYLVSQRLLPEGTSLSCLILAHPAQYEIFHHFCHDSGEVHFVYLDLPQLARAKGCQSHFVDSRADPLFMHVLIRHLPKGQFAPVSELRAYRHWQWRFALKTMSSVILVSSLLVAGKLWHDADMLFLQAQRLEKQYAGEERRYQQALSALPAVPLSLDALRALIDAWRPIERQEHALHHSLHHLASALNDFPSIELENLDWHIDTSNGQSAVAITDLAARLPVGMANDYRGQITLIEHFAARLASNGVQVKIVRLPFEIESAKSLRSTDQIDEAQPPRFSLRLSLAL